MPDAMQYIAKMKLTGLTFSYSDYLSMPALLRDDLISWNVAEQRAREEEAKHSGRS